MSKKNIILLIVLAGLIGLAYFYQVPLKKWQASLGQPQNFLAGLAIDKVDKIEIVANGQTAILEKQLNPFKDNQVRWKIAGTKDFFADTKSVDELTTSLKDLAEVKLELVSSNQEKKSEFGTDSTGAQIKLYVGNVIAADITVGNPGSDFASTYISSPGTVSTYSVPLNLNSAVGLSDWRDKTIFSTNPEKINKIRFQYPDREFTVEKKNNVWQGTIPDKFSVSSEKIDKILSIMSALKASQIPEQKFSGTGLEKHLIIIEAMGEGLDNVLMVGQANSDNLYFAKKGDSDNIYLITEEQRDELDKWIWQLK